MLTCSNEVEKKTKERRRKIFQVTAAPLGLLSLQWYALVVPLRYHVYLQGCKKIA